MIVLGVTHALRYLHPGPTIRWVAAEIQKTSFNIEYLINKTTPAPSLYARQVSEEKDAVRGGMLSLIVVHKEGDKMPGPGFFVLAKKLGRDTSDRERCWSDELTKVHANSR